MKAWPQPMSAAAKVLVLGGEVVDAEPFTTKKLFPSTDWVITGLWQRLRFAGSPTPSPLSAVISRVSSFHEIMKVLHVAYILA